MPPRWTRGLGAGFAVVLLAAGCGDDDGEVTATSAADGVETTSPAPGAGTTGTSGGTSSGSGSTGGTGGGSVTTAGGTAPASTTTTAATAASLAPGGVGDLAAALLQPGHGDKIVVEVRAQSGATPRSGSLEHLRGVLRDASGKSIALDGVDALSGGAREWTGASIAAAADAAAAHGQGGSQVVLRLLYLHGTYEGDDSVLGVSVRGDVAAIFSDQVDSASSLLVSSATIEDAVTIHETGHLLGLVDLAIDTGRDDPSHPGHSTNEGSVMYWAVESDLVSQVLGGGVSTDFDAQDRADLARIRAG